MGDELGRKTDRGERGRRLDREGRVSACVVIIFAPLCFRRLGHSVRSRGIYMCLVSCSQGVLAVGPSYFPCCGRHHHGEVLYFPLSSVAPPSLRSLAPMLPLASFLSYCRSDLPRLASLAPSTTRLLFPPPNCSCLCLVASSFSGSLLPLAGRFFLWRIGSSFSWRFGRSFSCSVAPPLHRSHLPFEIKRTRALEEERACHCGSNDDRLGRSHGAFQAATYYCFKLLAAFFSS